MEWQLENPRKDIYDVSISSNGLGRYFLFVRYSWQVSAKAVDDYPFPSDSAAKRYFATHYQSKRLGLEKPKWIKK